MPRCTFPSLSHLPEQLAGPPFSTDANLASLPLCLVVLSLFRKSHQSTPEPERIPIHALLLRVLAQHLRVDDSLRRWYRTGTRNRTLKLLGWHRRELLPL